MIRFLLVPLFHGRPTQRHTDMQLWRDKPLIKRLIHSLRRPILQASFPICGAGRLRVNLPAEGRCCHRSRTVLNRIPMVLLLPLPIWVRKIPALLTTVRKQPAHLITGRKHQTAPGHIHTAFPAQQHLRETIVTPSEHGGTVVVVITVISTVTRIRKTGMKITALQP